MGGASRGAGSGAVAQQPLLSDRVERAMAEGSAPTGTFPGFMTEGTLLYRRGEYGKALACFNNVSARTGAAAWGEAKTGSLGSSITRICACSVTGPRTAHRALPCRRCS